MQATIIRKTKRALASKAVQSMLSGALLISTAINCGTDSTLLGDDDQSRFQVQPLTAADNCDLVGRYFILDTTKCASSNCGKRIEFLAGNNIRFTHNGTVSLDENIKPYICEDGEISVDDEIRGQFDPKNPQQIEWDGKQSILDDNLPRRVNQTILEHCDVLGKRFVLDSRECLGPNCGRMIEFLADSKIRFTHSATVSLDEDVRDYTCKSGEISVDGEVRGHYDLSEPDSIVWDGNRSQRSQ